MFIQGGGASTQPVPCNVCTQKLPPRKCLSIAAAAILTHTWTLDSGNGVVTAETEIQSHYRDIWHLLSADMLSYLGADVEISCPGLLANSTSRNGRMDRSCPEQQDHLPPPYPTEEANCRVPHVPQPPAVATGISHYASNYVLGPVSGVLLVRTRV